MVTGFLTLSKVTGRSGEILRGLDAAQALGIVPAWDAAEKEKINLVNGEIPVSKNLFVDGGRQALCYVFGGRSPMADYACQNFGIGTGTSPAAVIDTALESPIAFSTGVYLKAVDAVSFITPFEARVEYTIGAGQANGYLITEFGLFSGNGILLARIVNVGINKTSDWSPSFTWRLRF
jgi:hypothetical protein